MSHVPRYAFSLAVAAALGACSTTETSEDPEIDALQFEETWVFAYSETPNASMEALGGGEASIVDGCLQMGDAVVIWRQSHLDDVEALVLDIEAGGTPFIQVGGGGMSLEEDGGDDFPDEVLEHCSPAEIWFAGGEPITFGE